MTPREAQLSEQLQQCQEALAAAQREIGLLRQKLDVLARRVFGVSSEALNPAQLQLLLQMPELAVEPAVNPPTPSIVEKRPPTPARKARAVRLPESLPVVEEVIEPEPVKQKPEDWRCIGQEVSEQLDYEPGRFLRRRTIRKKYVHRQEVDAVPVIASLPERLLDRSLPAVGLLVHLLVSKYCDHLPLYRLEQIFAQRYGVNLPRQTLARWVALAADWLKPIYEQIRTGVLAGGYVQMDETPIEYLAPGHGQTKQGYFWTGSRPGGDVFYHWAISRAATCLEEVLPATFSGTVQCDGYAGYRTFARRHPQPIILAGCWAHVRRKFHEALESSPRLAGWVMRQIQHLYQIEAKLREQRAGPNLCAAIRASQSRMIVERLERALIKIKGNKRCLPQSPLGVAIDYTLGIWATLEVYLTDGRVQVDNNLVENAIRPTAIGKKNWLFVGEAEAGERSAIIYTIIECCRRRGLDPAAYLRDVLNRLPNMTNHQIPEVTPDAWQKSQKQLQLAE